MKTFDEIKRDLEQRHARVMEAYEVAKRRPGLVPVSRQELAQLEEMCTVEPRRRRQRSSTPRTIAAPDWEWIRC